MDAIRPPHHQMKRVIDSKAPQECLTTVSTPKPNQVGTVLLYGIPIVSLYIESQERLCLAQISNTLLKQYSYNEIHNRRVALGITCVQCTPVQLEILRRAGAMPVSSRRCGMITRREAERLCKSFLGDNAPPRLPEDFAFNVHHECAWGCRGSFLPARYNSSRAKCIKCAYCGLFFSPNKFIFHSHRIGPGDKYVQPDAANFNSWRRHMKLSGSPPEEIIHAWEDVKAMFNGGTRKRLIISSSNGNGGQHGRMMNGLSSPKRIKESSPHDVSSPQIHNTSTVISTTATSGTQSQQTIKPPQLLSNGSISSASNSQNSMVPSAVNVSPNSGSVTSSTAPSRIPTLCSDIHLPFTRGLMMDYMWHAQTKASAFQFSNYALPWIKRPSSLFLSQHQQASQHIIGGATAATHVTETNSTEEVLASNDTSSFLLNSSSSPQSPKSSRPYYNHSAFRPVMNYQKQHQQQQTKPTTAVVLASTLHCLEDDQQTSSSRNSRDEIVSGSATIKESLSSDDEMVDIETTEEEDHNQYRGSQPVLKTDGVHFRHADELIKMPKPSPVGVDHEISNDINWDRASADYLKKQVPWRGVSSFQPSRISSPSFIVTNSSPVSSTSCSAGSDGGGADLRMNATPPVIIDPMNAVSSTGTAAVAAAAAAAVAIAAFRHGSPHSPSAANLTGSKIQTYESMVSSDPISQNAFHCDKGLSNNFYCSLIHSNTNRSTSNNLSSAINCSNNGYHNKNDHENNDSSPNESIDQPCSVARLSFDRMEFSSLPPFYRQDINKHFHSLRNQGDQTQTNGGIG